MNDMVGIIIAIVGSLVPLAIAGVIIFLIVQAVRSKDKKEKKFTISTRMFFQIYLYLISFLTLLIAVIGGATAIRGALSYQFDTTFSYTLYQANDFDETKKYDPALRIEDFTQCHEGNPVLIGDNAYCFNTQLPKTDLINGITIFVSMLILFAIHQYAISKIKKSEKLQWLDKTYTFASLLLYSIMGLITIPVSIYLTTSYLMTNPAEYSYSTPDAPAIAIAIAVLSLPLWITYLRKTSSIKEEE
jgi:hypothetical protein